MDNVCLVPKCKMCGKKVPIYVPEDKYNLWKEGSSMYEVFTNVAQEDLRTLETNLCSWCRNY